MPTNAQIILRANEYIEDALKRLNKQMAKGFVFSDYRAHEVFTPKRKKRNEKSVRARKRRAKYNPSAPIEGL